MSSQFDIKTWTENYELSTDTLKTLEDKGFSSYRSFRTLTPEIIKKEFDKKLLPAQFYLLQEATESLRRSDTSDTNTSTTPENDLANTATAAQNDMIIGRPLTASDIQAMWSGMGPLAASSPALPTILQGNAEIFDPLQFSNNTAKRSTAMDIRDYITLAPKSDPNVTDPNGTVKFGEVEFSLKSTKLPLEKVKIAQYMEASLRILRLMAIEDKADLSSILQYASYLVQIATMSQTFRWESVLKYDFEYRRSQAELGFPWGADNSYLMQVHLKPWERAAAPQQRDLSRRADIWSKPRERQRDQKCDPASGNTICQKWNGRNGCNIHGCRFAHVCMTCFSAQHPDVTHRETTPASKN